MTREAMTRRTWLRRTGAGLLALGAATLVSLPATTGAARAQAADAAGIRAVIEDQFRAFLNQDVRRAFDHASPKIRKVFRSAENFGNMVREGYPMVWSPGRYAFSTLEPSGGRLRQTVVITDGSGLTHVADYFMVQVDGEWRIDGVRLRPRQAVGA